jgi:hypothetical protein
MTSTFPGHTDAAVVEAGGIVLQRQQIADTVTLSSAGKSIWPVLRTWTAVSQRPHRRWWPISARSPCWRCT